MSRPLGASLSWGITSRTVSPAFMSLPVRYCGASSGRAAAIRSIRTSRFVPAATETTGTPALLRRSSQAASAGWPESRSTATSVLSITERVKRSLSAPSSPSSPYPAVSTSTHAPMEGSSIRLRTGSVVVPGTSLTSDTCWPASVFTSVDFPLLVAPKNVILRSSIASFINRPGPVLRHGPGPKIQLKSLSRRTPLQSS